MSIEDHIRRDISISCCMDGWPASVVRTQIYNKYKKKVNVSMERQQLIYPIIIYNKVTK